MLNKQFLLWLLPLSVVAFVAGPLAVLHSFDLADPAAMHTLQPTALSASIVAAGLPNTIPLMFEVVKYPAIGHQTLEVHNLRLMNLTSFAGMVGRPAEEKTTAALLGYMSMTEVLRQKKRSPDSYPVGDLLFVTKVYFTGFDDEAGERESLILETQRARRFRLKSVQYDESTELLFGEVAWEAEQTA
ncbi:hypothetical protein KRP22_008263 [Phytophthora ramorum]|uniref:uncharacterized protein n=1 Tax=Phytophthora ramorum TaxID=164328 RepID=UPI0030B23E27|nr:hypothetical protein KRP23_5546 [Phytophthora ramorum]KAH7505754.1 hypothetical protein KRP22_3726 [Phytophthora ramorum]